MTETFEKNGYTITSNLICPLLTCGAGQMTIKSEYDINYWAVVVFTPMVKKEVKAHIQSPVK